MVSHSILSINDDGAWVCLILSKFLILNIMVDGLFSSPHPSDNNDTILGVIGYKMPRLQCHLLNVLCNMHVSPNGVTRPSGLVTGDVANLLVTINMHVFTLLQEIVTLHLVTLLFITQLCFCHG